MDRRPSIPKSVLNELAATSNRSFPVDPLRGAALIAEEAGELLKAALDLTREVHRKDHATLYLEQEALHEEAVHTATMALRMVDQLERRGQE